MRGSWNAWWLVVGLSTNLWLAVPTAQAGLLPTSFQVDPDGSNFRFTYGVVLTSDSSLRTGDYFTIYDFAGFIPGSNHQPAGFSFSSSLVGVTPEGLLPYDDPNIPNLTWTYTGPDTTFGQIGLGNFWAVSEYGDVSEGHFTARSHRSVDGKRDSNITDTQVPVPMAPPAVPEPATLTLLGLSLPLVGVVRYRRQRPSEDLAV